MFHVKGWVSLLEVALAVKRKHYVSRIRRISEKLIAGEDPDDPNLQWNIQTEIWQICEQADELAVLLGNGNIVLASKELVDGFADTENGHVNLFVGTVGSGNSEGRMKTPTRAGLDYGPFFGLPVLLPEICLHQARGSSPVGGIGSMFDDPNTDSDDNPDSDPFDKNSSVTKDQSPASVAKQIIEAAWSNLTFTKAQYRHAFAPDLSVRKFEFAWQLAVKENPSLSKPGQKRRT